MSARYAVAVALAVVSASSRASAQACCAGSGAVTPGRLAVHEDALVGLGLHAAHAFGSFDSNARYSTPPSGSSEQDFEEDAIAAWRLPVVDRAQLALQVPFVETRRAARGAAQVGGGIGDVNVSARYDVFYAGRDRYVPGVAALVGLTVPTGRPPEHAHDKLLATDATGIGAFQANIGLAVEQLWDGWLVSVYGIVAKRTSRSVAGASGSSPIDTTLGTQWTALFAVAYSLPKDFAVAASASYTGEGNADINGADVSGSARRVPILSISGVAPVSDHFRFQGGVSANPPIPSLGKNQPATVALAVTAIVAWY
ncbi:MAG: hypothetical protein NVS3B10_16570 [Polyangiales bacterium]